MMNDWKDFFKSKRVTLIGLGLLGRGLGDAIFIAEHGAELIITDLRDEKTLAPSLERLKKYNPIKAQSAHGAGNISYTLGQHKLEDFRDRDFILKAAGVPLDSPYLAESRKSNVPVYMSTALFAKFAVEAGAVLVGVTGTRGKSTVTHMIHHALILAGKRAHLGGNVRGISTLALLPEVQKGDICVLELDSWQLQGFGDLQISPPVAVFTNLKQDHLNYYPTEETYFADKANIYKFQKVGDALIVGREVLGMWIEKSSPPIRPAVPRAIPADWRLNVLGEHNWDNAAFAAEALHALELSDVEIRAGLESFEPVEGRLQLIRTIDGVEIFNDNNATTPDATIAGLRALSSSPPARGGVSSLRDGVVGDSKSKIHDSRTKNIVRVWCYLWSPERRS